MTLITAIFLGIVQGLTEFLPVSSSGHLILIQSFMGIDLKNLLFFDLVCHAGTLTATLIYFFKQLININKKTILKILIGTSPLFLIVPFLPFVKQLFTSINFLSLAFVITGIILLIGNQFGKEKHDNALQKKRWRNAFFIGCSQSVAIIPGISRSGSTITTATLLGYSRKEAAIFSFLLAIPAILGGLVLEITKDFFFNETAIISSIDFSIYLGGFFSSLIAGMIALPIMINLVVHNALKYFGWYCISLGIFCFFYFVIH